MKVEMVERWNNKGSAGQENNLRWWGSAALGRRRWLRSLEGVALMGRWCRFDGLHAWFCLHEYSSS